jgi:hypothetical protein
VRRWLFRIGYLVVVMIVGVTALELGSAWIYQHYRGRPFSRDELVGRLIGDRLSKEPMQRLSPDVAEQVEELKDAAVPDTPVILHPFFGFIANPESPGVNDYGFFQSPPIIDSPRDTVTVAIFGGSLADQVFYMGKDRIIGRLAESPRFADKNIRVISTALGGYKQPQQLNVLAFMLARGARYDYVVNIDGFNELDSSLENFYDGISPFFPHNWKLHARRGLNPQAMIRLGKIEIIRERRRQLRATFSNFLLRRMTFTLALWDMLDARELAELRKETKELGEILSASKLPPRVAGPPHDYQAEEDALADLVEVWAMSSLEMDAICDRLGLHYLHFLQPNQYVPDSKPFTEEEQAVAFDENFVGVDRIPLGYPRLLARGSELRDQGVRFVDLTAMFANEPRTVYSDFCCHVNALGANLIADRVAAAILSPGPSTVADAS